jgi:ATP-dependent helicase YprA (DUF1998 family)
MVPCSTVVYPMNALATLAAPRGGEELRVGLGHELVTFVRYTGQESAE